MNLIGCIACRLLESVGVNPGYEGYSRLNDDLAGLGVCLFKNDL